MFAHEYRPFDTRWLYWGVRTLTHCSNRDAQFAALWGLHSSVHQEHLWLGTEQTGFLQIQDEFSSWHSDIQSRQRWKLTRNCPDTFLSQPVMAVRDRRIRGGRWRRKTHGTNLSPAAGTLPSLRSGRGNCRGGSGVHSTLESPCSTTNHSQYRAGERRGQGNKRMLVSPASPCRAGRTGTQSCATRRSASTLARLQRPEVSALLSVCR